MQITTTTKSRQHVQKFNVELEEKIPPIAVPWISSKTKMRRERMSKDMLVMICLQLHRICDQIPVRISFKITWISVISESI